MHVEKGVVSAELEHDARQGSRDVEHLLVRAGDKCVTVRERDSMEQVRIPISQLKEYLREKLAY